MGIDNQYINHIFIIQRIINSILLILIILLSGCVSTGIVDYAYIPGEIVPPLNYKPDWKLLHPGLELTSWNQSSPHLAVTALRIDLEHPERDIFVTPGYYPIDSDYLLDYEDPSNRERNFPSRTTSQFLEDFDCIAAVNATPFRPFRILQGKPQQAVGVVISEGVIYSSPSKYAYFSLSKVGSIEFLETPLKSENISDIDQAAGGFFIILKDGKNIGVQGERKPLSIMGLSEDERYLYMVVIDGEDKNWSIGASLWEGSEWMKSLGAYNVMILDGGGSSTLVIKGEEGKSLLLNKPSGLNLFSKERPVAVHIGIK